MSSNNVGHLITSTITTLQHFTTLHLLVQVAAGSCKCSFLQNGCV